jgi:hemerythrin-like domain-containing protein
MRATEILIDEHRAIERVLASLERATNRLSRGDEVYLRFFSGCNAFFKGFVDACHHMKEEQYLYPALVQHGLSRESGPIAVMLAEHDQGRYLAQRLGKVTGQFQAGDIRKRDELIKSASLYIRLLRLHIYKEEHIVSPLADSVIPFDEQELITQSFQSMQQLELGEDAYEKYFGMAERLEQESVR